MSERTTNIYHLPVAEDAVTLTVQSTLSHSGSYEGSIDFAVPLDTPIFAGADGVVTRVRDNGDSYGDNIRFGQAVNYISILHDNDEISEYLHLARNSALVKIGDSVQAGQSIAYTGLSGWLTTPHLHWMVYGRTKNRGDFRCLRIRLR